MNNNNLRMSNQDIERLNTIANNYNNAYLPQYNGGFELGRLLGNNYDDNQLMRLAYNIMQQRQLGNIPNQDLGYKNISPYDYREIVNLQRLNNFNY